MGFSYFFRVEEERRRQEALEEERKRREKERELEIASKMVENGETEEIERPNSYSGLADYDKGEAENEIQKLSQMVEQINPKLHETSNEQVDLDQLFNFLSKEVPDSVQSGSIRSSSITGSSETPEKSSILDEIDRYSNGKGKLVLHVFPLVRFYYFHLFHSLVFVKKSY